MNHIWIIKWELFNLKRIDYECSKCKMYKIVEQDKITYYTKMRQGTVIPDLSCAEFTIKKILE
jgi:hypothetical protein